MENQNINENPMNHWGEEWDASRKRGRVFGGAVLVLVGVLLTLQEFKQITIPDWLFSWQAILIFIGLFIGVKTNFRRPSSFILILIGSFGLVGEYFITDFHFGHLFWPFMIIGLGILLIFKPRNRWRNHWREHMMHHQSDYQKMKDCNYASTDDGSDYMDYNVVFGGVKKNIISKNFKGGEVNTVFGGSEINFTQADFIGTIRLELNCVMGGVKLIVPAHWQIKSEATVFMGSIEDHRISQQNQVFQTDKTLIIEGNVVMGGVEIKSY